MLGQGQMGTDKESGALAATWADGMLVAVIVWMSTARVSLAEVFHPWVRWEGPGSGFESFAPAPAESGHLGF